MWRIYYADGSTLEQDQREPVGDRARGVQVILQDDAAVGWYTQSGTDYYVRREGRWWGCDIAGLFDFLLDSGVVLFGRMIDRGEFSRIYSEALADQALAEKTGFLPRRCKDRMP